METKAEEIATWNRFIQIALLRLIPLVIMLVWIARMYDKLLTNTFLAVLLVLGVLVILFGGKVHFGPVRIEHKTTGTDSRQKN